MSKIEMAKPVCPYCYKASIDGFTHAKCTKKLGLDGLTSVWKYEGIIRKAILALKYKYATSVGSELTEYLIKSLIAKSVLVKADALVPIPLFWHRENVRGFNQSKEVGIKVADGLGWKFMPDLLIREKSTIPQAKLSGEDRRKNLKGVFSLNSKLQMPTAIILFDDVFTTGSTLKEAAKTLKRAGVESVWGLTVAR